MKKTNYDDLFLRKQKQLTQNRKAFLDELLVALCALESEAMHGIKSPSPTDKAYLAFMEGATAKIRAYWDSLKA